MNEKDTLNGKLIIALGRSYRYAHRGSNELFRQNGITLAQFTVLELLYNRGEHTIQQIIDKVLSSSGNITVVIRNLEQLGLIYRRENPEDKRSFLSGITVKAKGIMDEVVRGHMDSLAEAFSKLTDEEKQTVVTILRKLRP